MTAMTNVKNAMSTVRDKWLKVKPFGLAVCLGLIAGPFITSFLGWQVTSGTLDRQLHVAKVEMQAIFCFERVKAAGMNTAGIDYTGRRELAEKWGIMPGQDSAEYDVVRACSDKIVG
jgi:hypothetical protein